MKRGIASTLSVACVSIATVAASFSACGGAIAIGFDDAGVYHDGEGGVLVPGSGCQGWDTSHIQNGNPPCDLDAATLPGQCNPNSQCNAMMVPPGLLKPIEATDTESCAVASGCIANDAGGATCGEGLNNTWVTLFALDSPCHVGSGGDDYCRAYWGQYVTHGHALATCKWSGPGNNDGYCFPSANICPDPGDHFIAVQLDDGGTACIDPCMP